MGLKAYHELYYPNQNNKHEPIEPWFTYTNFCKGVDKIYQSMNIVLMSEHNSLYFDVNGEKLVHMVSMTTRYDNLLI